MKDYHDILDILVSNDYYKIKNDINNLINDSVFLKLITTFDNPFVFDRFIKMIQYKMDTTELYEKRNEYLKKNILNNSELPNRWLTEYIISYFFQDNFYNFMTNLFQMTRYISITKRNLINNSDLQLYNEFVDLNKMSANEKINLFKKYYQRKDIMEMFYDDVSIIREDSHRELVNNTIKLNKNSKIYQQDLSKRLEVDVYYLDGEQFYGFVRCLSINRKDSMKCTNDVYSKKNQLGYSFSYISDKNIGTIDLDKKSVTLFYDNIDYKNIMYVHHADLHAKKMQVQNDYLSAKENEILSPASLIARTNNYNEIYIKSDTGIKPTALICYDNITESDIAFAQRYELSLLLIDTTKYKSYKSFDEDYDSSSYCI